MKNTAVVTGIVLAAAGVILGVAVLVRAGQPKPSSPDQRIQHAKGIAADLRRTFEGGKLFEGNPREDARMLLVIGILKKVHYATIKKETDEARKQAILAELNEAMRMADQVASQWQKAVDARQSSAAKDLIFPMQKLETQMDRLTSVLRGKAP